MDRVLVVPLAVDEKEEDTRRLIKSSGVRDVIYCVDEDYPYEWPYKYGTVVRCKGFGVGKALDLGFRTAVKEYEWIIRTDNHVEFSNLVLGYRNCVVPIHYTPEGVSSHGLYLKLDWEFAWNHEPWKLLPCIMDPVFIVHKSLVEFLIKRTGFAFAIPYWGKENFDFTLTLSRLGYPVVADPRISVIHYYKKEWPKERIERRLWEPWMVEAPQGNPYFLSIEVGDAIFSIRHNWKAKVSDWAVRVAKKYFSENCRYVEGMSVEELYRRLNL